MGSRLICPRCGGETDRYDQPRLTVDAAVVDAQGRILLIERGHAPPGWALPGGFVDVGETLEEAVGRELAEETGLTATEVRQLHTYSDPARDPRHHTVSTVFLVAAEGTLQAGDDAADARWFSPDALPSMAFDHARVVADVYRHREGERRPR